MYFKKNPLDIIKYIKCEYEVIAKVSISLPVLHNLITTQNMSFV